MQNLQNKPKSLLRCRSPFKGQSNPIKLANAYVEWNGMYGRNLSSQILNIIIIARKCWRSGMVTRLALLA